MCSGIHETSRRSSETHLFRGLFHRVCARLSSVEKRSTKTLSVTQWFFILRESSALLLFSFRVINTKTIGYGDVNGLLVLTPLELLSGVDPEHFNHPEIFHEVRLFSR